MNLEKISTIDEVYALIKHYPMMSLYKIFSRKLIKNQMKIFIYYVFVLQQLII